MNFGGYTVTLAILTAITALVIGLLFVRESLRTQEALRFWTIGLGMVGIGSAMAMLHFPKPSPLLIALINFLIAGGLTTQLAALLALGRRRTPIALMLLPIAALVFAQTMQPDDLASRQILGAIFGAGVYVAAVFAALQPVPGISGRTRAVLAGSMALGALAFCLRAYTVLEPDISGTATTELAPTLGLLLIASLLASSFTMILIHHERDGALIHRLATLDPQTGIYNRRTLLELGQRELARAQRRERPLCALLIRIDPASSRRVPQEEDRAVTHLAELVASTLQRQDLFGRLGQHEFCAVLPDTVLDGGAQVAERLRIRAETVSSTECGVAYTLTLQVSARAPNEYSFAQLTDRANHALRISDARNCVLTDADEASLTRADVRQTAD